MAFRCHYLPIIFGLAAAVLLSTESVTAARSLQLRGHYPESGHDDFALPIAAQKKKKRAPFDKFPSLVDVVEMANLSHAVYKSRKSDAATVCDHWNNQTTTTESSMEGVTCHWYHHDKSLGTQVMIVSSTAKDYLSVVFAGTDDLKTSLLDVDVRKVDFGTQDLSSLVVMDNDEDVNNNNNNNKVIPIKSPNSSRIPVALEDCPACKVHEGFNNAVFANNIFDDIYVRVEKLRPQFSRLFTTGHSLGAANSILTAVGLAVEFEKKNIALEQPITSLNFGCPQVGNVEFRDYINSHFLSHSNTTQNSPYLVIWRHVLGWDLVPRLPQFFEHIGTTVQMKNPECKEIIIPYCDDSHYKKWFHRHHDDNNMTKQAFAYYHHIGNESLNYSGVPSHWSSTPYLWLPGALLSHSISRYATYLNQWFSESPKTWVHHFVHSEPPSNSSDALIDDDAYAEPPDDDAAQLVVEVVQREEKSRDHDEPEEESVWQRVKRKMTIAARF